MPVTCAPGVTSSSFIASSAVALAVEMSLGAITDRTARPREHDYSKSSRSVTNMMQLLTEWSRLVSVASRTACAAQFVALPSQTGISTRLRGQVMDVQGDPKYWTSITDRKSTRLNSSHL